MIVSKKNLLALVCLGLMVGCSSKSISNDKIKSHAKPTKKIEQSLSKKQIENIFTDKTVYYDDNHQEFLKKDGKALSFKADRKIMLGSWYAEKGKICFKSKTRKKFYCYPVLKKEDKILISGNLISLKNGDSDKLQNKYETENEWSSIDYSELYQLISGKTLIGGHKRYCPDNVKNKTCIKIAVLQSIEERTKGEKLKSTVIIPDRKKIIEGEWGYIPYNTFTHGLHIGIDLLPVGSSRFSFRENVSVNKNKNKIKIRNPRTKDAILISIIEGKNNQYLEDAKNHNYKKINNRGMLSLSQQISKKILSSIGKAFKEGAEYARTHPNANNSTNIENTKDVKSQTSSSKSSTPKRAKGGVKRVYVGSRSGGYAHHVVNCENGKSYSDLSKKSDGYWHRGSAMSNMGDDYKGLSINEVAEKLCK